MCHSRESCDSVIVTPPKGGGCHVTDPVTIDVTSCHGLKEPSLDCNRHQDESCHSAVTAVVTRNIAKGVTTLTADQLLPLALIIASQIAQGNSSV